MTPELEQAIVRLATRMAEITKPFDRPTNLKAHLDSIFELLKSIEHNTAAIAYHIRASTVQLERPRNSTS